MKYKIENLETYPQNGKHLECHVDYPFDITKGGDPFFYKDSKGNQKEYNGGDKVTKKWIVLF